MSIPWNNTVISLLHHYFFTSLIYNDINLPKVPTNKKSLGFFFPSISELIILSPFTGSGLCKWYPRKCYWNVINIAPSISTNIQQFCFFLPITVITEILLKHDFLSTSLEWLLQKVQIFKPIQIHLDKNINRGLLNACFVSHCCTLLNEKDSCLFFPFTKSDILNTKLDICNLCRYNTLLFHGLISDFRKILILCHEMMSSFCRWLDVLENGLVFMQWLFLPGLKILFMSAQLNQLYSFISPSCYCGYRESRDCAFSFEVVTNTTKSIAFCNSSFPCFLQSYPGISAHSEDQVQALQDWTFNSLQNK